MNEGQMSVKIIKQQILERLDRPVVLIGLMGAGKSRIGRLLADDLGMEYTDSDDEIVKAAGCSIPEIFDRFGEKAFRDGERMVLARLIEENKGVISTGGGAVMTPATASLIWEKAISIWVRADMDTTLKRVTRNIAKRPMLRNGNPEEILERLIKERYPVYKKADIVIDTDNQPVHVVLSSMLEALHGFLYRTEQENG